MSYLDYNGMNIVITNTESSLNKKINGDSVYNTEEVDSKMKETKTAITLNGPCEANTSYNYYYNILIAKIDISNASNIENIKLFFFIHGYRNNRTLMDVSGFVEIDLYDKGEIMNVKEKNLYEGYHNSSDEIIKVNKSSTESGAKVISIVLSGKYGISGSYLDGLYDMTIVRCSTTMPVTAYGSVNVLRTT